MRIFLFLFALLISSCTIGGAGTDDLPPVSKLNLDKYLGLWYEIARLPHSFEEGLSKVTAKYSLDNNGDIIVINRGWDSLSAEWSEAGGRAWLPDKAEPAVLKVSFFWPFSALYKVIELAPDYSYAVVTSSSRDYLWILARKPEMQDSLYKDIVSRLKEKGFAVDKLIMPQISQE